MRDVQDIVFDVTGQLVHFDCPEGRPSAVTSVSVFLAGAGDDAEPESAVGSPSVESNPDTTLSAAADAGTRTVSLTAMTGVEVDRRYLITSAAGLREWIEIESVSDSAATIRNPLHNSYASDDTLETTRITAPIDATWISDLSNLSHGPNPGYRVRWVYVVSGVTHVADAYFNVVRYPATHGVQPQDIEVMVPGWLDTLPTDHRSDQGRSLIDNAYREVRIDLYQVDISQLAHAEIVDELVRYKTVDLGEWAKFYAGSGDASRATAATGRYMARLDSLVRVASRAPVRGVSGASLPSPAIGLTRR